MPAPARAAVRGEAGRRRACDPVTARADRSRPRRLLDIPFEFHRTMIGDGPPPAAACCSSSRAAARCARSPTSSGYTTSTVSQQLAVLAREAGATLIEPEGRRVRLTPAGRRLADHAVTILAARRGRPRRPRPRRRAGRHGARRRLRHRDPAVARARSSRGWPPSIPPSGCAIHEHEPAEAFALLAADEVDLALVYDYTSRRVAFDAALRARRRCGPRPGASASPPAPARRPARGGDAPAVFRRYADAGWIVNSRNTADEHVVRTIASIAGFEPRDRAPRRQPRARAGPDRRRARRRRCCPPTAARRRASGVLALRGPAVALRAYAVTRRGREGVGAAARS